MLPGGLIYCGKGGGEKTLIRPIIEKMEQNTSDGSEEKANELKERNSSFHG